MPKCPFRTNILELCPFVYLSIYLTVCLFVSNKMKQQNRKIDECLDEWMDRLDEKQKVIIICSVKVAWGYLASKSLCVEIQIDR